MEGWDAMLRQRSAGSSTGRHRYRRGDRPRAATGRPAAASAASGNAGRAAATTAAAAADTSQQSFKQQSADRNEAHAERGRENRVAHLGRNMNEHKKPKLRKKKCVTAKDKQEQRGMQTHNKCISARRHLAPLQEGTQI